MRKILLVSLLILSVVSMTSCATIFGGTIDSCQVNRLGWGQPRRKIRIFALVGDLVVIPGLIIDFADCAIYKPCEKY
jgi:hypothetical protein